MKTIKQRERFRFSNNRNSSPIIRFNKIHLPDQFRSKSCNKNYFQYKQNCEKYLDELELILIKQCCQQVSVVDFREEQQQVNFYQGFFQNVEKAIKQEKDSEQSKSESKSKKSNQSSKDSTIPEDLRKVYDEIGYQRFIDKEQLKEDVLQLEALYYQLASLGLHISPMLSLPPIISYFTYSLFINNLDDTINLSKKDKQLSDFMNGFQDSTCYKLIQQGLVQSPQYQENIYKWNNSLQLIFLNIKPENYDFSLIDQNPVLEDYKVYRDLSIKQKDQIVESLDDSKFIWRKNNILITFLRFVFKNIINNEPFSVRIPVSEFSKIQFTDMIDIIVKFINFEIENLQDYILFLASAQPPHSEKSMLSFLLYDSLKDQQIFKLLEKKLGNIDQTQLILEIILMEVTSENRSCPQCVHTYNQFPIKQYCDILLKKFQFSIGPKLFLIVLSQYLNEPQFIFQNEQKIENKIHIFQAEKSKQSSEKLSNESSNPTEYFIIQEELGATGLLSAQFFKKRYCKQNDKTLCKTSIQEVQLRNTFFISTDFKEALETHKQMELNIAEQEQQNQQNNEKLQLLKQDQQQQNTEPQQQKKTRLYDLLNFAYNPITQLHKCIQISQQKEDLENLVDDCQTHFFASLMSYYCRNVNQKNFKQFKFFRLFKLLFYLIQADELPGQEMEIIYNIQSEIVTNGVIFNQNFNQPLILKDYKFLDSLVSKVFSKTPFYQIKKQNENAIHNEFSIQFFQYDNEQQQWQVLISQIEKIQIVENCKAMFKLIQLFIYNINQEVNQKYFLLVSMLYEIDERCKLQLVELIHSDLIINQLDIVIQFSSLNLITEKVKQVNKPFPIVQKNKINIKFEITNLLNYQNFMKRYQRQQNMEKISFIDTEQIINEFCCFDCKEHDEKIKQQIDRAEQIKQ